MEGDPERPLQAARESGLLEAGRPLLVLLSGGGEGSILVWDISGTGKRQPTVLAPLDLENCWTDLASADAGKAHRAIWRLGGGVSLRAWPPPR